jgi:hypothetical protein
MIGLKLLLFNFDAYGLLHNVMMKFRLNILKSEFSFFDCIYFHMFFN